MRVVYVSVGARFMFRDAARTIWRGIVSRSDAGGRRVFVCVCARAHVRAAGSVPPRRLAKQARAPAVMASRPKLGTPTDQSRGARRFDSRSGPPSSGPGDLAHPIPVPTAALDRDTARLLRSVATLIDPKAGMPVRLLQPPPRRVSDFLLTSSLAFDEI